MNKTIYVLHEYGAPTHYIALEHLATKHQTKVIYREFRILLLLKSWMKHPWRLTKLRRCLINIFFLCSLFFRQPAKIVIGIAPFNHLIGGMMFLLKRHEVYYHTSYSCWDGTRYAHKPKNERVVSLWRRFTSSYVRHIFAVSEKTKSELINNGFATEERITVVNHSYRERIEAEPDARRTKSFIFCGRMIASKGIEQLLEYFAAHPDCTLTLVGRGALDPLVSECVRQHNNIIHTGYIKGLANIIPYYRKASYLLLNSQRTPGWEELFGITLIEGMACGCVPITTDHPGPKEIITDGIDGVICREGEITAGIDKALSFTDEEYAGYRRNAIDTGRKYYCEDMAERWRAIFQ